MFNLIKSRLATGAIAVAGAILASTTSASADTTVGTIGLSLNVSSACVVNGASSLQSNAGSLGTINFPDQPGIFDNVDGQLVGSLGTLQVQCSPGVSPQLTVGSGANDAAGKRNLASSGNLLSYRLFSDAQRQNELAIGSQLSFGTATAAAISVPIYARVSSNGAVIAAGRYTDTVQVTLSW